MDKFICMRCKESGSKGIIPYKIIKDIDGNSVQFMGQLCTRCYEELFGVNKKEESSNENH